MIQRAAAASGRVPFTPVLDSRATASRATPNVAGKNDRRAGAFAPEPTQPRRERAVEDETREVAQTVMGRLLLSASRVSELDARLL